MSRALFLSALCLSLAATVHAQTYPAKPIRMVVPLAPGVLAPAATPAQLIGVLNDHVVKAMHAPDMAARFAHEGAELIASSPSQFAAHIKAEIVRWGKVVREADGLRAE